MTILLFGPDGQVGWELQRALAPLGELIPLNREGRHGLRGELADPDAIAEAIRAVRPHVIVNAAAHTAVDRAESEPERAHSINAAAPGVMADLAASQDALLVQYSTDYVFDGGGTTAWCETDRPAPCNVYGRTKLEGEEAIRASGCRHLILRTSWVYAARGRNFVRTMMRLASERDTLQVVNDQYGAPAGAELIADVTAHAVRALRGSPDAAGTYHIAPAGETTWYGCARLAIQLARLRGWPLRVAHEAIEPVGSEAFPTTAKRPHNSRLDTTALESAFGLCMPPWERGVERVVEELVCR